jgi:hypothetical protein
MESKTMLDRVFVDVEIDDERKRNEELIVAGYGYSTQEGFRLSEEAPRTAEASDTHEQELELSNPQIE